MLPERSGRKEPCRPIEERRNRHSRISWFFFERILRGLYAEGGTFSLLMCLRALEPSTASDSSFRKIPSLHAPPPEEQHAAWIVKTTSYTLEGWDC